FHFLKLGEIRLTGTPPAFTMHVDNSFFHRRNSVRTREDAFCPCGPLRSAPIFPSGDRVSSEGIMLQKLFQRVGRWWMVARFRRHSRGYGRAWAIGSMCAVAWLMLILAVKLLPMLFGSPDKWGKVLPVAGRVLLDGQPLHGGIVKFHPDASKEN